MPDAFFSIIGIVLVFTTGVIGSLIVDVIDKRTEPGYIPRRNRTKQKSLTR